MQVLADLIRDRAAEDRGDEPLLTFVEHRDAGYGVETRSYADLWRRGQALARALVAAGLRPGDRFGLLMQNHAAFVDAMVASAIAGTVYVPIDPRTRGKKLEYMLNSVECRGLIAADYGLGAVREVLPATPGLEWIWLLGDKAPGIALPDRAAWLEDTIRPDGEELPILGAAPGQTMQLLFTSGTTGDPKAIVGHYGRYAGGGGLVAAMGVGAGDVMYTGLSLTHANAMVITLGGALYNRIPLVISRKFSKSRLWPVIRDFGCTTLNLLGGMTSAIYSEPPTPQDADNPLRIVIASGIPKSMWETFEQRFGVRILEVYGAAEGGLTLKFPDQGPIGSIGKAPPSFIARVVDEDDRDCPPNVPGELIFGFADGSSPQVEYFRNAEASAAKTRDGWLRSGDMAYRDEDGWLFFLHRKGNELRRNGEFVSPGFIEKEIGEHPSVSDVFVYGVPSSGGAPGEKDIVAAVVLREPGAGVEALFAFCERRLERNSVPSYIQVVDEIPKTASEKPIERLLREAFEARPAGVHARAANALPA